jgi:lysophospholipase L1-like esterase
LARILCCLPLLLAASLLQAAEPFPFADGDRVILIGSTLIEREQRYGYWETVLTGRAPDRNIPFRNLGWSGDTVFAEARGEFDPPAEGFRRLKEQVADLKPTVVVVAYGTNEAFAGEAGLPRFLQGLAAMLDMLTQNKPRLVLLAPIRQEDLGRPLLDPSRQNRNIDLYKAALGKVAEQRRCPLLDLDQILGPREGRAGRLTDNGIHLTTYGYWRTAAALERGLGLPPNRWLLEIEGEGKVATAEGMKVGKVQSGPLRFQATSAVLPPPPPPSDAPEGLPRFGDERTLRIKGLAAGKYVLAIDGNSVATATAAEWAAGVALVGGPDVEQVERLREAIIEKNRLYFLRWRPENDTYLFGFRKQEQGQNAKEVPQLDPLIDKAEAEIAKLRVPVAHTYELTAVKEGGK